MYVVYVYIYMYVGLTQACHNHLYLHLRTYMYVRIYTWYKLHTLWFDSHLKPLTIEVHTRYLHLYVCVHNVHVRIYVCTYVDVSELILWML